MARQYDYNHWDAVYFLLIDGLAQARIDTYNKQLHKAQQDNAIKE